jgi:hypothetical protein
MPKFVLMVDNEVVESYEITQESMELLEPLAKRVAILRSNPVYMEVDEIVPNGYIYDGSTFSAPS